MPGQKTPVNAMKLEVTLFCVMVRVYIGFPVFLKMRFECSSIVKGCNMSTFVNQHKMFGDLV